LTLVVKDEPNDFIIEHVDLDLDPRSPGEVRIEKLQLPSGGRLSTISGQTSYVNKNLVRRDLILSDQEQIRLLNVNASRIDDKAMGLKLDSGIGVGQLWASAELTETESSLNATISIIAENVATESLNKFLGLPSGYLAGELQALTLAWKGVIDQPRTWSGTMTLWTDNMHGLGINFD